MKNVYEICYYGGLTLAILFLIVAVILFVTMKIPKVFGELTGRSASKSIKELKDGKKVEHSASKKEQAKYYNQGTGKIKAREAVSVEEGKQNTDNTTGGLKPQVEKGTEILTENRKFSEAVTEVLNAKVSEGITTVLGFGVNSETSVLSGNIDDEITDVLSSEPGGIDDEVTDVLRSDKQLADEELTDVLKAEEDDEESTTILVGNTSSELAKRVKVSYNIIITHTDEII